MILNLHLWVIYELKTGHKGHKHNTNWRKYQIVIKNILLLVSS